MLNRVHIIEVQAQTQGEALRYGLVRSAFLNAFLGNERVQELFAAWDERSGLLEGAKRAAIALEALAQRLGYPDRQACLADRERQNFLMAEQFLAGASPEAKASFVRAAEDERTSRDDFFNRFQAATESFLDDATLFVEAELKIHWPWLAFHLVAHFTNRAWRIYEGYAMPTTIAVTPEYPLLPPVEFEFKSLPDDSRFAHFFSEFRRFQSIEFSGLM